MEFSKEAVELFTMMATSSAPAADTTESIG